MKLCKIRSILITENKILNFKAKEKIAYQFCMPVYNFNIKNLTKKNYCDKTDPSDHYVMRCIIHDCHKKFHSYIWIVKVQKRN